MNNTMTDYERLTRARAQLFIAQDAKDALDTYPPGIRSHQGTGGMPHSAPDGDALPREVIRRDELRRRARDEAQRLVQYRKEARRVIGRMDRRMAMFAVRRYIYGEEIGQIKQALAGKVSASQIDRYKKMIEG